MTIEMITLGTVILTEFQKPGFRPLQSRPVQASAQALTQGSKVSSLGQAKRWPCRISGIVFSDVTTITQRGIVK